MGYRTEQFSAVTGAAVTPGTGALDITDVRGLYSGAGGDIAVRFAHSGEDVTFVGVPAGVILPIQIDRVYAVGTTATDMVVLG